MDTVIRWVLTNSTAYALAVAALLAPLTLLPQQAAAQVPSVTFEAPFAPSPLRVDSHAMEQGHSEASQAVLEMVFPRFDPWFVEVKVEPSGDRGSWERIVMNADHCAERPDAYGYGFDVALAPLFGDWNWQMESVTTQIEPFPGFTYTYRVSVRLVLRDQPGETAVCDDPSASPVRFHELPSGQYEVVVVATLSPAS